MIYSPVGPALPTSCALTIDIEHWNPFASAATLPLAVCRVAWTPVSSAAFVVESAIVGTAASLKFVVCTNDPVDTKETSLQLLAPALAPVFVTEPGSQL